MNQRLKTPGVIKIFCLPLKFWLCVATKSGVQYPRQGRISADPGLFKIQHIAMYICVANDHISHFMLCSKLFRNWVTLTQADINFSSASGHSCSNISAVFEKKLRQNRAYFKFWTQTRKFQSAPRKIYSMASQGREALCFIWTIL